MKIGALDRRIEIQGATVVRDPETNEQVPTWATVATVWANRRDVSARESLAAGSVHSEQLVVFTIRWRAEVDTGMRVLHDGQVFDLTGKSELGRRKYLTLQSRAVDSNGSD